MLVSTRKLLQTIRIGDDIVINVKRLDGNEVDSRSLHRPTSPSCESSSLACSTAPDLQHGHTARPPG